MTPWCDTNVYKNLNIKNNLVIMKQTTSDNEEKVINYYEEKTSKRLILS